MSIDELQEQVEKFKDEMDVLEEVCDTLDLCKEDDGCDKCENYKKIEKLNLKIGDLEEKIESLMGEDEEDEEEE